MPSQAELTAGEPRTSLSRILGLGFGLAVIFGGTVGVGILRLPGTIAAQMGSFWPIMLVWIMGGIYAMLGAISIAELGTAMPQAGGFYVYSKRAFGPAMGFAVGWADWLCNCAGIAYAAVAAAEYTGALVPSLAFHPTAVALLLLLLFSALQWIGLRLSSSIQQITSSVTALTFLVLVVACLLHPARSTVAPTLPVPAHAGLFVMLVPIVAALRAIIVAYDGWYEGIYFTEEDTDVTKHLPRAMIGGVAIILGLYVLMNLAFLHVLSIPALAASTLPAADAARLVFPAWSGTFITVLSLFTLLSLMNAVLLGAPRIIFGIGRDGLFSRRATEVGAGGTPRIALLFTAVGVAAFIASGKFEEIIAITSILLAVLYFVNYLAVIVLRVREPDLPRPFRVWGYPVTTGLVLVGSLLFLIAAVHDDHSTALRAAVFLFAALPVYLWMQWRRRRALAL
jgi:APA family basic amino acid/polyamine antiporter